MRWTSDWHWKKFCDEIGGQGGRVAARVGDRVRIVLDDGVSGWFQTYEPAER